MRTEADLQLAFGLLERDVDDYLASKAVPGEPVALVRPVPRHHGRRSVLLVVAAAIVALLVLGSLGTYRALTEGGAPSGGSLSARSLVFSLDPIPGVQLLRVTAAAGAPTASYSPQEAVYLASDGQYRIDLSTARSVWKPFAAQPVVDVRGRRAMLGCLSGRGETLQTCANLAVNWQYAPGSWVVVFVEGDRGTRATLLRIARGLDFDRPLALRSPLRLGEPPRQLQLQYLDNSFGDDGSNDARSQPSNSWWFSAGYGVHGAHQVVVGASGAPLRRMPGTQPVTVAGRRGYWSAKNKMLNYDAGHGAQVQIGFGGRGSLSQALAIAATVSVVDHPERPDSWLPAEDALP